MFHKSARTASQKSQFLPILAPAIGIDGKEWVNGVIEAFRNVCLCFEGYVGGPLFRPPNKMTGGPSHRGLSSGKVTKFLRLLFEVEAPVGYSRISSHSLKATLLSWSSKAGLSVYESMTNQSLEDSPARILNLKQFIQFIQETLL